jgi:hypothetical protein
MSVAELEQFFRLDAKAWKALASKRRSATKLRWAVQWGLCGSLQDGAEFRTIGVRGRIESALWA